MLAKFGISRQIFLKFDNVKFHENLSSRVRADICGETDRRIYEQNDRRTEFCRLLEGDERFMLFDHMFMEIYNKSLSIGMWWLKKKI